MKRLAMATGKASLKMQNRMELWLPKESGKTATATSGAMVARAAGRGNGKGGGKFSNSRNSWGNGGYRVGWGNGGGGWRNGGGGFANW